MSLPIFDCYPLKLFKQMEHLTCVFSNFSKQFNVSQLYFFQNLKKKVENSEICFIYFLK